MDAEAALALAAAELGLPAQCRVSLHPSAPWDARPRAPPRPGDEVWVLRSRGRSGCDRLHVRATVVDADADAGAISVRAAPPAAPATAPPTRERRWLALERPPPPPPRGEGDEPDAGAGVGAPRALLVVDETPRYRRLARAHARARERWLEVGCDTGAACAELARSVGRAGAVLGVDKAAPSLAAARARKGGTDDADVRYAMLDLLAPGGGDALAAAAAASFGGGACDGALIDINGNRELDAVLSAVGVLVAHVGTPEVLIVKSRALHAELVARAAPPRLTASLPAPRAPPPECEEEQSRSAARVAAAVS